MKKIVDVVKKWVENQYKIAKENKSKIYVNLIILSLGIAIFLFIFRLYGIALLFFIFALILFGLSLLMSSEMDTMRSYVLVTEPSTKYTDRYDSAMLQAVDKKCLFTKTKDDYVAVLNGLTYYEEQNKGIVDLQFFVVYGDKGVPTLYEPLTEQEIKEGSFLVYDILDVLIKGEMG